MVGEFPDGAYPRHVHQINARRRESYVISTAPNKESEEKQGLVILANSACAAPERMARTNMTDGEDEMGGGAVWMLSCLNSTLSSACALPSKGSALEIRTEIARI